MWRTLGRPASVHRIKIQSELKTVSDVLDQLNGGPFFGPTHLSAQCIGLIRACYNSFMAVEHGAEMVLVDHCVRRELGSISHKVVDDGN